MKVRESDSERKREFFSPILKAIVNVAVLVVEQERGLELQVSCPESTLATILPITIEMESARVLKMEFFSVGEEARVSELLSDLKIELCSTKDDA